MRDSARCTSGGAGQGRGDGIAFIERHLQPETAIGKVGGLRKQPLHHLHLPVMQRDLEALQLCRAVHPHDLDRLFQGGPAGKAVLARDHMQVIGVLQGLALGARLTGGNAGARIRGSGLMGLPQRLGIAA